jgi:hypothetical protein
MHILIILAAILLIPLCIYVEGMFVNFTSNKIFDTDLSYKESFIICLKKFLALLVISIIFGIISSFADEHSLATLIINYMSVIIAFLATSAIFGTLIDIGFWKGMAVNILSTMLIILTIATIYGIFFATMLVIS